MVRRVKTKHIEEIEQAAQEAVVEEAPAPQEAASTDWLEGRQPVLPGMEEAVRMYDNGVRVKWVEGSVIFHILGGSNVPSSLVKGAVAYLKQDDDKVKNGIMSALQEEALGVGCSAFDALLVARRILRGDFDNHAGIEAYK